MKLKLRTQLSISYILLGLFLVALISVLTNVFLERQFREYIIQQQEAKNIEIVDLINHQYDPEDKSWNKSIVEKMGVNALEQGLIIKVVDEQRNTIWDATVHNHGLCIQMIDHMSRNMASRYPNFQGGYQTKEYSLKQGSAVIGQVKIGYYGPYYLTDSDLAFLNTLNKMLAFAGVLSLILSLIVGALAAGRLSNPISETIRAAREIGNGQYKGRIREESNTVEIDELTSTINDLAEGLENQEKLRKRLTADVAHELRTPLATLQSHVEAMIDGIWEMDAARLTSCHEEIVRISRTVGDLETLARYDGENLHLNQEAFDLLELAQQIGMNFEVEFLNKQVDMTVHGTATSLFADRGKIGQVLFNLISNALKYTPPGQKVDIWVGQEAKRVVLRVKNTGVVISAEDLPHIFERFYRADQSRTRETGGSGIGLAIVRAIVEAHGGKVGIQSTLEEGTIFTVSLPFQEKL